MPNISLASFLLRIGIAFTFVYAAISALVLPEAWIGFYPAFIRDIIPDNILLLIHSVGEIVMALWLLSGWKTFYAATVAGLWVLGIILGTLGTFIVTFRDVAILFAVAALAVLEKK